MNGVAARRLGDQGVAPLAARTNVASAYGDPADDVIILCSVDPGDGVRSGVVPLHGVGSDVVPHDGGFRCGSPMMLVPM